MTHRLDAPALDAPGQGQRGRRVARRRLALVGAAVLAAGLVTFLNVRGTTDPVPSPALRLAASDGVVTVSGQHFTPGTPVDVSATFDGGSGDAVLTPDTSGAFRIAFRPPAGFTGRVEVSADPGARTLSKAVDVAAPAAAEDGSTPAPGVQVVPMTGAPVTPVPRPDPGMPRVVPPADVAANCSVDVTAPLNAWLQTVPDGSWVDFPATACYRVDGSLLLQDRTNLLIEGNGATFRAGTRVPVPDTNRAQWFLSNGSGITLRDMTLVGVNPEARFSKDDEFDHNVFIRGTQSVTVENVHGRNTYGDFISIAQGMDERTIPTDITIRDVSADTVGRMGIACVACDGVSVEDSVFNNIAYHVFDLEVEGDGRPGRNITYTGNTIGSHGWAFFSVGTPYQTYDNDVSNVHVSGNTMTAPGRSDQCLPAVSFRDSKIDVTDVVIEDNVLLSHSDAVMVKRVTGVTVRGNTARLVGPTCGSPVGVRTVAVAQADVEGNDVQGYRTSYEAE